MERSAGERAGGSIATTGNPAPAVNQPLARFPILFLSAIGYGREVTYMDAPGMQCFLQLCNKTGRCSHISGF
ncbi:hypothetical protein DMN57_02695 [Escherichia coli]|nr:hypothetical protein [Escherichia coli]